MKLTAKLSAAIARKLSTFQYNQSYAPEGQKAIAEAYLDWALKPGERELIVLLPWKWLSRLDYVTCSASSSQQYSVELSDYRVMTLHAAHRNKALPYENLPEEYRLDHLPQTIWLARFSTLGTMEELSTRYPEAYTAAVEILGYDPLAQATDTK